MSTVPIQTSEFKGDKLIVTGSTLTQKTDDDGAVTVIDGLFLQGNAKWLQLGPVGNTSYQTIPLDMKKFAGALRKGDNVFAAHVHQTCGGQFFDCGLEVESAP